MSSNSGECCQLWRVLVNAKEIAQLPFDEADMITYRVVPGYVVGAWLLGIIANLWSKPEYRDIALRDFGLALGALALARIASDTPSERRAAAAARLSTLAERLSG